MANRLQVYLLDPQEFTPETIAVTFAKTSRSPETFKQIAAELNETKSAEFNEKWVVGYGHSSVAEHAVLHIAVENISRLATECLESNRLASYTEKSTRYQTWEAGAFIVPQELEGTALKGEYQQTCQTLLDKYQQFIPLVGAALRKDYPKQVEESEGAYDRHIRSMTTDVCRFLLPASVLANVGMTINARALEHAIAKMLSNPLQEVREVGQNTKKCAVEQLPTLLKYAEANEYLETAPTKFAFGSLPEFGNEPWCQLVHYDADAENRILAACLYRFNNLSYTQSITWLNHAGIDEKNKLAQALMSLEKRHTIPLRELEHANFTFDITIDQGGYYEVKRHRMLTLTPQDLSVHLGYAVPNAIEKAGLTKEYCTCMKMAQDTFDKIQAINTDTASYVVPNAFNRRFLVTSNLRSLIHFIKLRSAANAHFSVRRLAQQMAEQLTAVLPAFAPYLNCYPQENVESIEKEYFFETQRR